MGWVGSHKMDPRTTLRCLGLSYKQCAVIPVAGQRTHGTTFRALKVTSQVATPGAESAVYDSLVVDVVMWLRRRNSKLAGCRPTATAALACGGKKKCRTPVSPGHLLPPPYPTPTITAAEGQMSAVEEGGANVR